MSWENRNSSWFRLLRNSGQAISCPRRRPLTVRPRLYSERLESRDLLSVVPFTSLSVGDSEFAVAWAEVTVEDNPQSGGVVDLGFTMPLSSDVTQATTARLHLDFGIERPLIQIDILEDGDNRTADWSALESEPIPQVISLQGEIHSHSIIFRVTWEPFENYVSGVDSFQLYARLEFELVAHDGSLMSDVTQLSAHPANDTASGRTDFVWRDGSDAVEWAIPQQSDWFIEQLDANQNITSTSVQSAGELPLVLQPEVNPAGQQFIVGTLIDYNSATGNLRLRTDPSSALSAFDMFSPHRWFSFTTRPSWRTSFFDVANPGHLFHIDTAGFNDLDLGDVLPTGLTYEQLVAEFRIDGAMRGGGAINSVVWSVDAETSLVQAVDEQFAKFEHTGSTIAYRWIDLTGAEVPPTRVPFHGFVKAEILNTDLAPKWNVKLRYLWQPSVERDSPPLVRDDVAFGVVYGDGEFRGSGGYHMGCEEICEATIEIAADQGPVWLVIRKNSAASAFVVESWEVRPVEVYQTHTFAVTLAADAVYHFELRGHRQPVEPSIVDERQDFVTNSNSFDLAGPATGQAVYYVTMTGTSGLSWLSVYPISEAPTAEQSVTTARALGVALTLTFSQSLDPRTCTWQDIVWNGPGIEPQNWRIDGQKAIATFDELIPRANYQLEFAPGSCASLTGSTLTTQSVSIDSIRPRFVRASLQDRPLLEAGSSFVEFEFDEPVTLRHAGSYGYYIHLVSENVQTSTPLTALPMLDDRTFVLPLTITEPGNYRLSLSDIVVIDRSENVGYIAGSWDFVVSAPPRERLQSSYDLNQDGLVNYDDLRFLMVNLPLWSDIGVTRYDLNDDGQVDELDGAAWRAAAWAYPAGDVDLDGDFDEADLQALALLTLDSPADWQHGDFDGDGRFTTADLVLAFQFGLLPDSDDPRS
ncbi:MAG: hypothetical protein KDB23_11545 [Planctomycetales bacterium]|nr:hypothetical protein [Planctomycetales bacterium]